MTKPAFVVVVVAVVVVHAACSCAPRPELRAAAAAADESCDEVEAIVDASHAHDVVLLGEQHRRREEHVLLQQLVRDPRFASAVQDVVVEFGNARAQPIIDRYVQGDDVAPAELAHVWHDTTQIVTWDSPVYADFFAAVRDANRHGAHLRVWLGDPPIDWAHVASAADYAPFAGRDAFMARVVEHIVADQRRVLVVVGAEHIVRTAPGEPADKHPGVGDVLRADQVDAFSIMPVPPTRVPPHLPQCRPAIVRATGALGATSFGTMMEANVKVMRVVDGKETWVARAPEDMAPIREKVDALLWLGTVATEVPSPPSQGDDLRELHRRARIMSDFYGFDLEADLPP